MSEKKFTFLVPVDDSEGMRNALRYAARRARLVDGRVALLYVVESGEIETWGVVERALADEAFDKARQEMVQYEEIVKEVLGSEALSFYCKGSPRAALLELIEREPQISVLVLGALSKKDARNPLLADLTSEKGLKKLPIPVTIVPACCRCDDSGAENLCPLHDDSDKETDIPEEAPKD